MFKLPESFSTGNLLRMLHSCDSMVLEVESQQFSTSRFFLSIINTTLQVLNGVRTSFVKSFPSVAQGVYIRAVPF